MKLLFSCLGMALLLGGSPTARACKYCEMAASDPETRLSAQVGGQSFPLESVINQYQSTPPAANLYYPPKTVATKAADLPARPTRSLIPPPAPIPAAKTVASTPVRSGRGTDAGLLGLAAAGGIFFWRTRRRSVLAS